jgi:hypothetical protein
MNDTAPTASRSNRLSAISSGLALAVSVFALALGAWQTRLMQQQARASVWPHLSIGYTFNSNTDDNGFVWTVDNSGVGPARIESIKLTLDGKPMKNWRDVLRALGFSGEMRVSMTSLAGEVIPPSLNRETTIAAIRVNQIAPALVFKSSIERFKMDICYCSVYDDCWIAHWATTKIDTVDRCDEPGPDSFVE